MDPWWDLVLTARERSCDSYVSDAVKSKVAKRRWISENMKMRTIVQ